MDIFSMLALVDTVISITNGFIQLRSKISKKQSHNVLTHADGRRYEGSLLEGVAHGRGVLIYPDGTRCEGEFRNGEIIGTVKITWTDGRYYEGEWLDKKTALQKLPYEVELFEHGQPYKFKVHPAVSSQEPFLLEYFGDISTSLFDRWFCYQQAFERASELSTTNKERTLHKLATIEAEADFPALCFKSVAAKYKDALMFCQNLESSDATIIQPLNSFITALHDSCETLKEYQQSFSFLLPLQQYLSHLFDQLSMEHLEIRRQNLQQVTGSSKFLTDRLKFRWEGSANTYLLIAKPRITIGRCDQLGKESDLLVLDTQERTQTSYISRFHAILEYTPHGFQIFRDNPKYDIWIEREGKTLLITQPTVLRNQDIIGLGKKETHQGVIFQYHAFFQEGALEKLSIIDPQATLDEKDVAQKVIAARLEIQQGFPQSLSVILCAPTCSIGRDTDNAFLINDQRISRRQASITHQNGGFWLADAGSKNGTFINDESCCEPLPILAGDIIKLGQGLRLHVL